MVCTLILWIYNHVKPMITVWINEVNRIHTSFMEKVAKSSLVITAHTKQLA